MYYLTVVVVLELCYGRHKRNEKTVQPPLKNLRRIQMLDLTRTPFVSESGIMITIDAPQIHIHREREKERKVAEVTIIVQIFISTLFFTIQTYSFYTSFTKDLARFFSIKQDQYFFPSSRI